MYGGYLREIIKVYDGDTVYGWVDLGWEIKKYVKFRLYGINTPEIRGGTVESKKNAIISRDYLANRLKNAKEIYVKSVGQGKYGRWLGIFYVDGVDLNAEMVELGYAVPYMV